MRARSSPHGGSRISETAADCLRPRDAFGDFTIAFAHSIDACIAFAGGFLTAYYGWRPALDGSRSNPWSRAGAGMPGASSAAPLSLDFGGSTLQRLRSGNAGSDRFTEYGRKSDRVAETLT